MALNLFLDLQIIICTIFVLIKLQLKGLSDHEAQQLIELIDSFENSASIAEESGQRQPQQQLESEDVEKEEEDLFRSYMQQKEQEYQISKQRLSNLDVSSIRQVAKSSSGNSSLASSSTASLESGHGQVEPAEQESRHRRVTFEPPNRPKPSDG